jgi:hypothetical protein
MACSSRSGIPGRAYSRKTSIVFSIHFTQPNRPEWEWDWQSAVHLWKDTVGEYGRPQTSGGALRFTSRFLPHLNGSRRKSLSPKKRPRSALGQNRKVTVDLRHVRSSSESGRQTRQPTFPLRARGRRLYAMPTFKISVWTPARRAAEGEVSHPS